MRTLRTAALAATTAGALLNVGCVSSDRHVFEAPQTRDGIVTAVTADGREEIWRHEIPAGHKLVVDLDRTSGHESPFAAQGIPADDLEWALFPANKKMLLKGFSVGEPLASGQQTLPGTPVLLVYSLKAPTVKVQPTAPEIAPETPAGETEAVEPAEPEATDVPAATEEAPAAEETMEATEPAEAAPAAEEAAPEMTKEGDGSAPDMTKEGEGAAPAEEEPVLVK